MSATEQDFDYAAADFNAVYTGGELLEGAAIKVVPWDIGEAQPDVVELEQLGRFHGAVLDIGCGPGDNAVFLARRGYRVTAIDAASAAVEQARRRAGDLEIEFAVADATDLTGYEGRFDSVLDSALFHTLPGPARPRYAAALHRVTRPGAQLSVLCFADVPGGMPAPLSVPGEELRGTLTEAGWDITSMELSEYAGVAVGMEKFFERTGRQPQLDAKGRTRLPIWKVFADRVSR
ncbi:class I SAM-dependent methyltransferase [Streptomyces antimicrobicus]|uniref:Class I SAM-dependent methyltransferase n=1 Tax=Streptomyces antimicrobicus TaxID=2883108 RepID=A0ABS8B7K9_9ACTN|nr:class I SAM-dependent methyltransferase [Streptomyces antimicrobicus]MCB5180587.1 class I SAM-dependent methyltransferase [Streptomyces antimicrobicus]